MFEAGLRQTSAGQSEDHRPRDFHFAFGFALLAVLLHTCALVVEFGRAAESVTLNSSTVPLLLLLMELGLLLNVAGLWLRKAAGMFVSLAGLSLAGIGYVIWYLQSRQILELLLSKSFPHSTPEAVPPHPFGLLGATWVNLVVLVMTGVLFVWVLKRLPGLAKAAPDV
jgi:hypothetical protein